jgi:hypothetical protein
VHRHGCDARIVKRRADDSKRRNRNIHSDQFATGRVVENGRSARMVVIARVLRGT